MYTGTCGSTGQSRRNCTPATYRYLEYIDRQKVVLDTGSCDKEVAKKKAVRSAVTKNDVQDEGQHHSGHSKEADLKPEASRKMLDVQNRMHTDRYKTGSSYTTQNTYSKSYDGDTPYNNRHSTQKPTENP